jgi:hypothetical protein
VLRIFDGRRAGQGRMNVGAVGAAVRRVLQWWKAGLRP